MLRELLTASYHLPQEAVARAKRFAVTFGLILIALVLFFGGWQAGTHADADRPLWELVIFARLVLMRLVVAMALLVLTAFSAVILFNGLDVAHVGKRLFNWTPDEPEEIRAQKVRNAALVFCAVWVGVALVLAQVLR